MSFDLENLLGGYAIEKEDRSYLLRTDTKPPLLKSGEVPDVVDPRNHPLWSEGYLQVEDQGRQGSCQGQSLSECVEYCYSLLANKVLQFSRQYSYIRSQQFDGIRTDSGSTLSGGTKAAMEGICTEATGPYRSSYPNWSYITDAMKTEAAKYKLQTHSTIRQEEEVRRYIGSGLGIVQIGIAWNRSMEPDGNGCIRNWSSAGGGGHAVVYCGYVTDQVAGQRSSKGYWYLLKNSWGRRWGVNGFAYVDPSVISQQLQHRWSVFVGRSDMKSDDIAPRPVPVDFTKINRFG